MYQHPIPQNVSTYQFRLIGDMTVRQFMQLAIGIGLGLLIYFSNLADLIKLPLAIITAISGIAFAFMPLEERGLDVWLKAFIKSIYRPTEYVWQKNPQEPTYFSYTASTPKIDVSEEQELALAAIRRKQEGLSTYLQTLPQHELAQAMQAQEDSKIDTITNLFTTYSSPSPDTATHQASSTPPISTFINAPRSETMILAPQPASITNADMQPPMHKDRASRQTTPPSMQTDNLNRQVLVPDSQAISIDQKVPPDPVPQPSLTGPQPLATNQSMTNINSDSQVTQSASSSNALPFPSKPKSPNTLVGMVLTKDDKAIQSAIVEVLDKTNIPVRATKTNKLGQFFSTTPLSNGDYLIRIEKEGHKFDTLSLTLSGQIVSPLKISAK